ncbi:MAG: hypothetical protein RMM28_02670 [Thermoleophilia bacterium]|nr:hypothetical protein [Thermoleophilia bacterium]
MTKRGVGSLAREAATVALAARGARARGAPGALGVSGPLADQLARELAAGAAPGAGRTVAEPAPGLAAFVLVIAGEPSERDRALVAAADRLGVPVVLVQIWPQAEWARPYVLSPFVVECRAGEGFPTAEIALRVAEAVEDAPELGARVPVLRAAAAALVVRRSVARAALLALRGQPRAALTLEQLRPTSELRALAGAAPAGVPHGLLATAGAVALAGVALRELARAARRVVPAPLANAAVAAAGTWALASAARRLGARIDP